MLPGGSECPTPGHPCQECPAGMPPPTNAPASAMAVIGHFRPLPARAPKHAFQYHSAAHCPETFGALRANRSPGSPNPRPATMRNLQRQARVDEETSFVSPSIRAFVRPSFSSPRFRSLCPR
eukprot:10427673-Alexandrium_andersonii.AAC.1